ncbi:Ankyrin repeat domain-containing protein 65 [Lasiodiplodia theobromae]|uniref:Ankyrin repeat domain-containing protein 65 n=1 Tax=Lasiodiplodia theobromae TaxID=45133 RepID=UPI0015C2D8BD|nr:Ankyrin repeat domain-containing protein 65 [Lasiodiplodia theobromae]KAF4537782.1 Ankyrin repeat domain-containing protein 65 [Lasiodiplodia theobromae]
MKFITAAAAAAAAALLSAAAALAPPTPSSDPSVVATYLIQDFLIGFVDNVVSFKVGMINGETAAECSTSGSAVVSNQSYTCNNSYFSFTLDTDELPFNLTLRENWDQGPIAGSTLIFYHSQNVVIQLRYVE